MPQTIKNILLIQKQELENKRKEEYIPRRAKLHTDSPLIQVILGPRRAGKSFFAIHTTGDVAYANFDDEQLTEVKDYDEIIVALNAIYNNPKLLLFDEIQNLPKWELFVNRLQRQGYQLIVTGSNSNLLNSELSTHLTGRHLSVLLLTFSFKEYVDVWERKIKREPTSTELQEKLLEYLTYGGYPEAVTKELNSKEYISTLYGAILFKDIVQRFNLRSGKAVSNLALYLLSNIASEYSYYSLSHLLNLKSSHTIKKYLGFLEEAFIFFSISRFSYKVREQISSNKKIYCFDNGFIHAKAFQVSANLGHLYENAVARELYGKEVYFWKNAQQEEVDFVVREDLKIVQLIQVCTAPDNFKTKQREIRALLKASQELPCDHLLIITADYEGEEQVEWFGLRGKVKFIPLWKWLLENK